MAQTRFSTCRSCGVELLGDREPVIGICGGCLHAPVTREPRPLVKSLAYECAVCGGSFTQSRMGRPRLYCPSCAPTSGRAQRRRVLRAAA